MPKPLSILTTVVAVSTCAALVYAQEVSPAERTAATSPAAGEKKPDENKPVDSGSGEKPSTKPTTKPGASAAPAMLSSSEEPTPTPKPKKRSFFGWLFGSHKQQATSAPESTPKPGRTAPTPKPTPKATSTPRTIEKPSHGSKPGKLPPTTPKPEKPSTTPKPEKPSTTPKPEKVATTPRPEKVAPVTTPPTASPAGKKAPKVKPSTPSVNASKPPVDPGADADPEAKEKFRFELAKAKAVEDPQIKSLKAKADEATTDQESRAALRAYNKALFEKVKKIDSGVSEWADRLEAAMMKRLSE